jgi:hypothetical protein
MKSPAFQAFAFLLYKKRLDISSSDIYVSISFLGVAF